MLTRREQLPSEARPIVSQRQLRDALLPSLLGRTPQDASSQRPEGDAKDARFAFRVLCATHRVGSLIVQKKRADERG